MLSSVALLIRTYCCFCYFRRMKSKVLQTEYIIIYFYLNTERKMFANLYFVACTLPLINADSHEKILQHSAQYRITLKSLASPQNRNIHELYLEMVMIYYGAVFSRSTRHTESKWFGSQFCRMVGLVSM